MIEFKKWQKIQQFHNIRKRICDVIDYKRSVGESPKFPVIHYRAKIKLDGTNAAIRIVDGIVAAQSRTRIITLEDDNYGFAAFVHSPEISEWASAQFPMGDVTIYGEWCGKGIQKRCSVSRCEKMFVIFAVEDDTTRFVDPYYIGAIIQDLPESIRILPWHGEPIFVDYGNSTNIHSATNRICEIVKEVEDCDPYIKEVFGHEGVGEGLVYYPYIVSSRGCLADDEDLVFKAKGEKHANVTQLKPVIMDPELVADVEAFVSKFVTENRMEQGLSELQITDPSTKDIGQFLKWIANDIMSESKDEMKISGLKWKDVSKRLTVAAKGWLLDKMSS